MPKRKRPSTPALSYSSSPRPSSSSSAPTLSPSSNDEPSNYPRRGPYPKVRPSKYTIHQQDRLNHLLFGLGCCRWTTNSQRMIRDVWLHVPEERGGGEGIGLTPPKILQYCKSRGMNLVDGDERFEEFFRWSMDQIGRAHV